jgi:hypothetical protein
MLKSAKIEVIMENQNNKKLVGKKESFYEQFNFITKDAVDEKREFDKKFFYVVSSFFAFSILLVQFLKNPVFVNLLLIAWYYNLWALLFHLFAHLTAEKSHLEKRQMYIDMKEEDEQEREKVLGHLIGTNRSVWDKTTVVMEMTSYFCFVLGTMFLLWFAYLNLI